LPRGVRGTKELPRRAVRRVLVAEARSRARPDLEGRALAPMTPFEIGSRDGLVLPSYLSLPPGADRDGDRWRERGGRWEEERHYRR